MSNINAEKVAVVHIQKLKKGVLLVRLHTQDALIEKMKYYHRDLERKNKLIEIKENNMATYVAFNSAYKFSELRFFYSRDSKKVRDGDFDHLFLNSDLEVDTSIRIDPKAPIYILDVGDIYFPNMSGHQEGVIVMDKNFEPLKKPFPYYVRKRSGMAIIKRTDLDIAIVLNEKMETFYEKSLHP
ncbi:MAG: hypothetical protein ACJAWO_000367 [Halieaceae bacterium]|jgi:hypothetical protein